MKLPIWVLHIIAFFRGGHDQIVRDLRHTTNRLHAHAAYKDRVISALDDKITKLGDLSDQHVVEMVKSASLADAVFLAQVKS